MQRFSMLLACIILFQSCLVASLASIENLRRRKTIGTERWRKEQKKVWKNKWYIRRWIWLQKECEDRLKKASKESKAFSLDER